ncbi:MAG: phosphatase PAP2 family protein [Casimicrobiaceae bacterium]
MRDAPVPCHAGPSLCEHAPGLADVSKICGRNPPTPENATRQCQIPFADQRIRITGTAKRARAVCPRISGEADAALMGAAAIGVSVMLFAIVLGMLGWFATTRESDVRHAWRRFLGWPGIDWLRRRYPAGVAFLEARLSPTGYFGINLTLGALVVIGAGWIFGGIAEDVVTGDPLTKVDNRIAAWFHAQAVPPLTRAMLLLTELGGLWGIAIATGALALHLAWRRQWHWLGAQLVAVPGGMLVNVLSKYAFARARPSFVDPLLTLTTYSFPSGHVAASTLFYGFLAAYLVARVPAWGWRVLFVLSSSFIVALVGLTRVYLGVHFLSDVLAAFALGTAWLAMVLTTFHTFRAQQSSREGDLQARSHSARRH